MYVLACNILTKGQNEFDMSFLFFGTSKTYMQVFNVVVKVDKKLDGLVNAIYPQIKPPRRTREF